MNSIVHSSEWKQPTVSDTQIVAAVLGLLTILGIVVLFFLA
jgi:hypothetical protein